MNEIVLAAPSGADTDAALAAALVARAPAAARCAWLMLLPLVRAILRREVGAAADEGDLTQEVFLRFFKRIDELRDPGALRGFAAGIALGVARNERRRARIRRCVALTATGELPSGAACATDFEAREALLRLNRLLTEADAEDRSLFLSRTVDRAKLGAIASMTGHRLGAIKGRVSRALRRLSARMRHDEVLAGYAGALAPLRSGAALSGRTCPRSSA